MSTKPAIVIKSKFVMSGSKDFKNYVDYVDRKNTKSSTNDFKLYQDYMSNEEKTSSLFTKESDRLNDEEKSSMKNIYDQAQRNGSIMWQDVISFDNDWLKEQGIYNPKDKTLDETKIKEATRKAMFEMLKKENMESNSVWSAAIHYNTDNIHVHISTVQPTNPRERGKRKQSSIDNMKSNVINKLMDRSMQNKELNDYIRKTVIGKKKEDSFTKFKNRSMAKDFKNIHEMLPNDKRKWNYNDRSLNEIKPLLNNLTDKYIEKNFKKEHKVFLSNLDKEVQVYKRTYGENSNHEKYKETKINDLYTRMGNTILKEMKDYDKKINPSDKTNEKYKPESKRELFRANHAIDNAVYKVDRYMKDDYKSWKNQEIFKELQQEINYER